MVIHWEHWDTSSGESGPALTGNAAQPCAAAEGCFSARRVFPLGNSDRSVGKPGPFLQEHPAIPLGKTGDSAVKMAPDAWEDRAVRTGNPGPFLWENRAVPLGKSVAVEACAIATASSFPGKMQIPYCVGRLPI